MKLQINYPRKELNSIGKQRFQGKNMTYFNKEPFIVSVSNNTYKPYLKIFSAMLEENNLTY